MLLLGDCRDSMAFCLGENEVDAIVTVAKQHGRKFIGCELNPAYVDLARARIAAAKGPGT